jgi:cytochrome c-type biogenesis protein
LLDHVPPYLAFVAGLTSFLSPCVLPLVPAYIAYLGGRAAHQQDTRRPALAIAGAAFVLGLSLVMLVFFYAYQSLLSPFQHVLAPVAGVLVILLALQLAGLLRIPALQREYRLVKVAPGQGGPAGGLLLGIGFAAGWTPCIGPTLGAILTSGSQEGTTWAGLYLLALYCLGLGLPFLALAVGFEGTAPVVAALNRRRRLIDLVSAAVLASMGVLLLTGQLTWLTLHLGWLVPDALARAVAI